MNSNILLIAFVWYYVNPVVFCILYCIYKVMHKTTGGVMASKLH